MLKYAGKILTPGSTLLVGDVQYAWPFAQDVIEALGIEVVDAPSVSEPDPLFYMTSPNGNGGVDAFPRDLTECQNTVVERIKATARIQLSATDWVVTRALERGEPIPQDVLDARQDIRDASNSHETAVLACDSIDDLAEYSASDLRGWLIAS